MNNSGSLLGKSPEDYGDSYSSDLLDIYTQYIKTAEQVSVKRQGANSFFLTINTAIVAFLGYLQLAYQNSGSTNAYIPVAFSGIILCLLWYRIIKSYSSLNDAKFKIIHELENYLPVRPFKAEWDIVGLGKNPSIYLPFTRIEIIIPFVFMFIHSLVLVRSIC